ncbi:MAG: hypothetical protein KC619_24135 [Myxococcales bacterium]|nr:hypothetical protein [Myxococcales bacterium]
MDTSTSTAPAARPRRRRGERIEGGRRVGTVHARMDPTVAADLRIFAAERGEAISSIVARAVREFMDREDAKAEAARKAGEGAE